MIAHAHEIGHHAYEHESIVKKGRDATNWAVVQRVIVQRKDVVKYLLVFNPKAKRYSRASETSLVRQAARLLSGTVAVTYYDWRNNTPSPATLPTDEFIVVSHNDVPSVQVTLDYLGIQLRAETDGRRDEASAEFLRTAV